MAPGGLCLGRRRLIRFGRWAVGDLRWGQAGTVPPTSFSASGGKGLEVVHWVLPGSVPRLPWWLKRLKRPGIGESSLGAN